MPGVICNVVKADVGRWTPGELRIDALNTLQQTWQMNILWLMDPPVN